MSQEPLITPPSPWYLLMEGRAVLELSAFLSSWPFLERMPEGDGHPVLVYPGFMASDASTKPLRYFLDHRGYVSRGWGMGRNRGYSEALHARLRDEVRKMYRSHGRRVSLVGWSLGGVFAREIAREHPDEVRQVITLGSPFANPNLGTNVTWLYRMINRGQPHLDDQELHRRLGLPVPVPSTAIFSRTDGIVHWHCARERSEDHQTENIEVRGSHFGLGHNPFALYVIGNRLSQPEGAWQRFDKLVSRALLTALGRKEITNWQEKISDLDAALARLERLTANKRTHGDEAAEP